ncbi:MAG: hypothetical protein RIQ94_296 [Pseudomonadota bacterium]|jgi:predicted O-linked N-acetylglucosamine transferase (SPINDLY family)
MKSHKSRKKNRQAKASQLEESAFEPNAKEISAVMALISQGRHEETIVLAQALTNRFPLHEFGWKVLGAILHSTERSAEALLPMMMTVILAPDDAEAHSNLGQYFKAMGRIEEAEVSCRRALEIDPEFIQAHHNLSSILFDLNRLEDALVICHRLLELSSRALALNANDANIHNDLGFIFMRMGRIQEAEASLRQALKYNPTLYKAYNNMGMLLADSGRYDDFYFKKALDICPNDPILHSSRLYYLAMSASVDDRALFTEHLRYAEQFEVSLRDHWQAHENNREPARSLQIGFVSGDFYHHAVASFIEPLLIHLSTFSSLTLHAYVNNVINDKVTKRLQGYFAHWTLVVGLSDQQLATKIRADGIDILIDLSGHTAHNRLLTFARKPAPIQASWMGYPGTTGLQAMDYYLADRFFVPQEPFKDQFTEKLVYLPANAPFMPYEAAPAVNELPALTKGYITFGSFNRLNKLSPEVVAVWAKLMQALPTSRLLLAAMPEAGYDTVINWFSEHGITQERLSFYQKCSMGDYITLHHQVDICLDTFPYNGGTTTCHATWMGVPTLTMVGQTPAGRTGALILSHVGLENLIADNVDDYVNKGLRLANDIELLAQLRIDLRSRFKLSSAQQPELIAKGLEQAFRLMWQRWCDDLPPISLDVSDTQMNTAVALES